MTPEGSEELIAMSQKNNTSYVVQGNKEDLFFKCDLIKMNITVNLRSVRKNFQNDDLIKLKFSVSTKNYNEEFDRDDLN